MYARYTEYLRDLMNNSITKPLLDKALSTYPLYTPVKTYDLIPTREQLNNRILNHYKYREIGFETVGRFLDELEITMCEIMPRYNELFKTVETMAELPSPFDNVDVVEKFEQTRTATSSSTQDGTRTTEGTDTVTRSGSDKIKHSDTPQNSISDIDNYMSDYTETTNNGSDSNVSEGSEVTSNTGSSTATDTLSHTYTKTGNQGVNTYAHDMNEFRTSIIDVVDQIVNDARLNELFMMVY